MKNKDLEKQIFSKLKQIEQMIEKGEEKNKIEIERKKLDKMLEQYVKDI